MAGYPANRNRNRISGTSLVTMTENYVRFLWTRDKYHSINALKNYSYCTETQQCMESKTITNIIGYLNTICTYFAQFLISATFQVILYDCDDTKRPIIALDATPPPQINLHQKYCTRNVYDALLNSAGSGILQVVTSINQHVLINSRVTLSFTTKIRPLRRYSIKFILYVCRYWMVVQCLDSKVRIVSLFQPRFSNESEILVDCNNNIQPQASVIHSRCLVVQTDKINHMCFLQHIHIDCNNDYL